MSQRTDVHRPSVLDPDAYEWVAFGYLGTPGDIGEVFALQEERARLHAHMAQTGGKFANSSNGICAICGNQHAMYVSYFYYPAANEYLRVGWICAEKLEWAQGNDQHAFRTAIKNARELKTGKRKAEAVCADNDVPEAWTLYDNPVPDTYCREQKDKAYIVRDILRQLVRYGDLSTKQWAFIRKLLDEIAHWDDIVAQREAEHEAAKPAPTGRVTVTGEVLSVKFPENGYNGRIDHKMLVKTDDGWKLWVSVPSVIDYVDRGDRVTLTCQVTPSNDDPKFAFGKRPTKPQYLGDVCEECQRPLDRHSGNCEVYWNQLNAEAVA